MSEVSVKAGDRVLAGDAVAALETEKVYALQDGTVCFFGEAGDSAEVRKGDVLFETLSGSYANASGDLCRIAAAENGVVFAMNLTVGAAVASGETVMTFYPDEAMRIEATVTETDLQYFAAGDQVRCEFTYLNGGDFVVTGTIESISAIGAAESEETDESSFTVLIIPESTEGLSYGMNAVISRMTAGSGN